MLPPVVGRGDGPTWAPPNTPVISEALGAVRAQYQSVAGQPAAALQRTEPLTLVDFIDARLREIGAEHERLHMLKQQLVASGVALSVDDVRRVLG